MKKLNLLFVLFATVLLGACESEPEETLKSSIVVDSVTTNFDPANSVIPFPNDLLFKDTADGTLNIPVVDATDLSDPAVALNVLDGFSTVAPMSTGFTDALDAGSINGNSVRVYQVTLSSSPSPGGAVVAVNNKLTFGIDYFATLSSVDATNSTLVILPLKPLLPKSHYYVAVTRDLKAVDGTDVGTSVGYALAKGADPLHTGGVSAIPALSDEQAQALEPLRQLVSTSEFYASASDATLTASDIIVSWSFTTQSTDDVLTATRLQDRALTAVSGFSPAGVASPLGAADINVGILQVPYYLTASSTVSSPSNDPTSLGSCWNGLGPAGSCASGPHATRYNPAPVATTTQTIPMMVSIPKAVGNCAGGMPGAGWPVVIYQHGITTNRATMMAVADAMAGACMAVVAIDMPMHGITGNETNGTQAFKNPAGNGGERTFDLDLVTQDANGDITAAVPDGVIDSSGRHFINLTNLLNTRDNIRQAVSDLFVLVDAIEEGKVTDGANTMDPAKIYFLGHSLGAMAGTVFTAVETNVRDAVFAFGGGGLPKIIDGSAAFGPSVAAGLAANGVVKGTADYESFFGAAQTVIDSADPLNFATSTVSGRGVLFFEIVGGNSSPSDLVVPNRVADANDTSGTVSSPLAGTEPLLALMGLTHVNATTISVTDLSVVTKFISGEHSSLLDPTPDAAVTTEIQTQMANFFGSDGTALVVTDDTVLLAPAP